MIYNSKEMIVLQVMLLLVVFIGWKYTKMFFHGISRISNGLMKMNYSIVIMIILGRTGFRGVEFILVLVMLGRLIPVFNS